MRETVKRKTGGTSKVERGDSVRRASAAGVSGTARPRPGLHKDGEPREPGSRKARYLTGSFESL